MEYYSLYGLITIWFRFEFCFSSQLIFFEDFQIKIQMMWRKFIIISSGFPQNTFYFNLWCETVVIVMQCQALDKYLNIFFFILKAIKIAWYQQLDIVRKLNNFWRSLPTDSTSNFISVCVYKKCSWIFLCHKQCILSGVQIPTNFLYTHKGSDRKLLALIVCRPFQCLLSKGIDASLGKLY